MRRLPLALALIATAGVLALLLAPHVPVDSERLLPHGDKVAHAGMFALLTGAWRWAGVPAWTVWLAAVGLGIATEVAQWAFLPTRSGDPFDALADALGASIAVVAWSRLRRAPVTAAPVAAP